MFQQIEPPGQGNIFFIESNFIGIDENQSEPH